VVVLALSARPGFELVQSARLSGEVYPGPRLMNYLGEFGNLVGAVVTSTESDTVGTL
jgi:hypothetical protein